MKNQKLLGEIKENPDKKGVIFIGLNTSDIQEVNNSATEGKWKIAVSDASLTIAHELGNHAIPDMEGTSQPVGVEHEMYHKNPLSGQNPGQSESSPTPSQIRNLLPDSKAGAGLKESG